MAVTATKACAACRERKRKCDRALPGCGLCYRLGRQCHYDSTTRSYALSSRSDSSEAESRRRASPKNSVNSPIFLDQGGCPFESDVATTITAQLSHALGDLGDLKVVQETAQKYFASIHLWYPTISEDSFYERLPNTFSQPSAAYSLLILGMGLITTIPILDEPLPPLYTIVKSLIAVAEASNIHSIEVVQTRLLVSLFEVGHGLETAAFISLASTARAAAAIGLNETIYPQCKDTDTVLSVLSDSEEGMRVWWGIVMLDRNFSLERGDGPCATQGFECPRFLPKDRSILDQKLLASEHPLSLSTPSHIRVGAFARQAQVSHILDILRMHLNDVRKTNVQNLDESDQIARTLTAFSLLIPEDSPQPFPRYCGAIGMCYGALMALHESRPKDKPAGEFPGSPDSLEGSMERVTHIARIFNSKFEFVHYDGLSLYPPNGLYKAATNRYQAYQDTGNIKHLEGANELMIILKHFGKRWMAAAKYFRLLEKQRDSKDAPHLF